MAAWSGGEFVDHVGHVQYSQLAHGEQDAASWRPVPRVLYTYVREGHLATESMRRLIVSSRYWICYQRCARPARLTERDT